MKKNILKVGVIVTITITLFLFFLPNLVKHYLVKNAKELVGTEISISNLKYNYFTSTLKIYNFKLYNSTNKSEFISLDTLLLNLEPLKLINNKTEIEKLKVTGLSVNVSLKDSVFNFDDLIAFHSTDTVVNTNEDPFKYSVSNIEFKNSKFKFDNQDITSTIKLKNIDFKIPFIGWDQEHKSSADIKFNFENGGFFESILNLNPNNGAFDANIILDKLSLEPFYQYTLEYANIKSLKGKLDSNIHIVGNIKDPASSIVYGKASAYHFEMTDEKHGKLLAADTINCSLSKIDYHKSIYKIDSLILQKPYVHFSLDTISNNMFRVFKLYPEEAVLDTINTPNDSIAPLYYAINHLEVNKGMLDYSDIHTGDLFEYHLSDIEINSDSIFSDAKNLNIKADMLLNKRGTLNAALNFDPSDFMNSVLNFRVENFLLSDVNIYANHYMGHNVLKGDFYYYSHSKIVEGQIDSENKLLVKNVSVKSKRGGLYNLPLKFALFLLKDSHGDVNLDIPVRGNLNDPKVNIGRLVWHTFKNLIVKVVTKPVKFLSGLVDGNPEDLKEIKFSYSDTILSKKQMSQLDKLLKLEKKKDGLKINLSYAVDKQHQQQLIAKKLLGKMYFESEGKNHLDHKEDFKAYLQHKVNTDTIPFNNMVSKLSKTLKTDSIANLYDSIRTSKIKNYLKLKNNFTQISITDKNTKKSTVLVDVPTFNINYTLSE